jgi:outer membrane lipoprotein-sorting protein
MKRLVIVFLIFYSAVFANEAEEIVKRLDENIRGVSVYMQMKMQVTSFGHTRVIQMQTWSKGTKKSFVKIIYPPRDKGITFLSLDNQMWQYIPKIERTIKIPPSMMLQNWMGSDITNDDVVKQSSIVEDYDPKILKKEGKIVTLELMPKENAPVVWGKIISRIDTSTYTSQKDIFFDEEGKEVRRFLYKKVKKFSKYYLPTYWKLQPSDKKNSFTEIFLEEVVYDEKISEQYFQKSALKRFSR